jgi:hypothetical protein
MAFSRALAPRAAPESDALTSAMVGIGMGFAARAAAEPNIEDTLFFASVEAMERDDLRVLAVLVTWFGVHARWVNADRLTRLVAAQGTARVRALWSALAVWQAKDRRFARLGALYDGPRVDLQTVGSAFHIRKHGEDPRFSGSRLRVPANVLRDRAADVLSPRELALRHRAYRSRLRMGPTYRADVWVTLEAAPHLSTAELARRTYASFATAWQAKQDFEILDGPPRLTGRCSCRSTLRAARRGLPKDRAG